MKESKSRKYKDIGLTAKKKKKIINTEIVCLKRKIVLLQTVIYNFLILNLFSVTVYFFIRPSVYNSEH